MVEQQQQQQPRFRFSRPKANADAEAKAKASNVAVGKQEGQGEAEAGACSLSPSPSPNLYVANCGPAVGLSFETIASVFAAFGQVTGVHPADDTGARVVVSFSQSSSAQAAFKALHNGSPCPQLGGRILHIQYSLLLPTPPPRPHCDPHHPLKVQHQAYASVVSSSVASDLGIPGIYLLHDFVSPAQEQELLAAVDARPWKSLAKRRVQHYGYEFLYKTRNVDPKQFLGDLPSFVSSILEKITLFPNLSIAESNIVDQLTVNEYPPGVGLSPHIDTHSAFDGLIFSLSLAGPCIMEFRKYPQGTWLPLPSERENSDHCSNVERRAIFLPPRSMLLLSGEARYAWHHYIPHHKVFNELNSREIEKINVISGIFGSWVFIAVIASTVVFQIIIVEFLGAFASTVPLSWHLWIISILIGFVSMIVAVGLKCIPVEMVKCSGAAENHGYEPLPGGPDMA